MSATPQVSRQPELLPGQVWVNGRVQLTICAVMSDGQIQVQTAHGDNPVVDGTVEALLLQSLLPAFTLVVPEPALTHSLEAPVT